MKFRVKWNKERKDVDVDPSAGVSGLKQAVNEAFGKLAFHCDRSENTNHLADLQASLMRAKSSYRRGGKVF